MLSADAISRFPAPAAKLYRISFSRKVKQADGSVGTRPPAWGCVMSLGISKLQLLTRVFDFLIATATCSWQR